MPSKIKKQRVAATDAAKSKKKKHRRTTTRSTVHDMKTYIRRLARRNHPGVAVSKGALQLLQDIVDRFEERVADESDDLMRHANRKTLTVETQQTAMTAEFPGDLIRHAVAAGHAAVAALKHGRASAASV